MVVCSFANCKNRQTSRKPSTKFTFHKFPTNPDLRDRWLDVLNRGDFDPNDKSVVCSDHFQHDDFVYFENKKILKSDAVPEEEASQEPEMEEEDEDEIDPFLSEDEEEFVSPRKAVVEKRGRNKTKESVIGEKDRIKTYQKRLRVAKQQNKRLSMKLSNAQDSLRQLKEENESHYEKELSLMGFSEFFRLMNEKTKKRANVCGGYSADLKNFALNLHFYSPKAYDYVRQVFHNFLPHPRTLRNWYGKLDDMGTDSKTERVATTTENTVENMNETEVDNPKQETMQVTTTEELIEMQQLENGEMVVMEEMEPHHSAHPSPHTTPAPPTHVTMASVSMAPPVHMAPISMTAPSHHPTHIVHTSHLAPTTHVVHTNLAPSSHVPSHTHIQTHLLQNNHIPLATSLIPPTAHVPHAIHIPHTAHLPHPAHVPHGAHVPHAHTSHVSMS